MHSQKRTFVFTVLTIVFLCAAVSNSTAQTSRVNVRKWFGPLTLQPGDSKTWFSDNVSQNNVRWFTAVPSGFTGIDQPLAAYDQKIEVTHVFYILKGQAHAKDGSGGQNTLQVNITVKNLDMVNPVTFDIYGAETF